ncbi:MAG: energy-coupling factor transporter transmembrane protein EcfT [Candidatus Heimdallarchaeota archaeon]|nr:energy-coupling factor transporter transmembrane protein EcfT [Candidatus Heimdallarchaeota archaeon]MCK5183533.1 energy-coupling factor transporter transmembrane protein EcfT [Candidatus Heimdallarchaeota archaeon]MCK5298205.1 energy-coupling factor transporter transmembrane protein EcfT [Candidatus Heimdallarchaeota archaeon]
MAFIQSSTRVPTKKTLSLDPRTKLLMLFAVSIFSFMIENMYLLLFLLNIMLIFVIISRVDIKKMIRYVKPTFLLIPTIFIIQLLAWDSIAGNFIDIPVSFGFLSNMAVNDRIITVSVDALIFATNSCLRILNLAIGSSLFSLTTNSNDYLQSLTKIGVPFEIAFTTGLVIYFLPLVISETTEMRLSLETRGVSINRGNFISRLRSFSILATSILMNFIEKSKYQAIALESRGFNSKRERTYYRKIKFSLFDIFITILILGLIAGICYVFRADLGAFFAGFVYGFS